MVADKRFLSGYLFCHLKSSVVMFGTGPKRLQKHVAVHLQFIEPQIVWMGPAFLMDTWIGFILPVLEEGPGV